MFQLYPEGVHEHNVQPGFDHPQSVHNYICLSDDDGLTWSIPRDITKMTKRPSIATSNACGPGIGIELKYGKYAGRIIIPFNQGPYSQWEVYTVFSDDHGETWQQSRNVPRKINRFHGNEVQVVERANGSLLLNCRSFGKSSIFAPRCRKIAISHDGGYSWSEMQDDRVLIESSCQASLFRYSYPENGVKSRILFSNPAVQKGRYNGTIRLSYNEGMTWAYSKTLVPGHFAYSCLTRLMDGTIGCLFETGEGDGYNNISFCRFSLGWLTENKDPG
jgi:sialidase-1